jgi:hypothetical protein
MPADVDDDPDGGSLERVTGGPGGGADPNTNDRDDGAAVRFLSEDGQRAYVVTRSPIAGADSTPPQGGSTAPGGGVDNVATRNLYLYDARGPGPGAFTFVAQIPLASQGVNACASSSRSMGMTQVTQSSDGLVRRRSANCVRGVPDGSTIVFESSGQLTTDDDDAANDVYLYDAATDTLERVSAPLAGATPYPCDHSNEGVTTAVCNADFGFTGVNARDGSHGLRGQAHTNLAVSAAGVVSVLFESRLQLIPEDNGSRMDVYQWRDGELSLVSPGSPDFDAWFSGNSIDGQDVFISTMQPLDPYREIDPADLDVYDARIGGGFPPPPSPKVPCDVLDDACQGPGPGRTAIDPASGGTGSGNVTPRGRVRLSLGSLSRSGRARAMRRGVLSLAVRTSRAGEVSAVARARLGGRSRVVGRASKTLSKAGEATVTLRLSGFMRRRLRAGKPVAVDVKVAQPGAKTVSRTIKLARAGR